MIRKSLFIVLMLAAANVCTAAGWTGALTIESAFTEGTSDFVVVYTTDASSYASGCSVNNWIIYADSEPRRNRAYGTILTALASGQKVRFWFSDACSTWGYHQATGVMIVQ